MAEMSGRMRGIMRVTQDIRFANRTGNCPVCKYRPHGWWPDGVPRILCGEPECVKLWLPGGNATDAVDVAHDVGEVGILEGVSETEGEAV